MAMTRDGWRHGDPSRVRAFEGATLPDWLAAAVFERRDAGLAAEVTLDDGWKGRIVLVDRDARRVEMEPLEDDRGDEEHS